jgi:uncharacterized protein (TIGR02118 family)
VRTSVRPPDPNSAASACLHRPGPERLDTRLPSGVPGPAKRITTRRVQCEPAWLRGAGRPVMSLKRGWCCPRCCPRSFACPGNSRDAFCRFRREHARACHDRVSTDEAPNPATRGRSTAPFGDVSSGSLWGMTVKLVVLYTQPEDAERFDAHYLGIHGPLVEKIPGLLRWEGARIVGAPDGGDQTYHRVAELYFTDPAALQAALATEQGKATAGDYQQIAPAGSRMFVAAVDD